MHATIGVGRVGRVGVMAAMLLAGCGGDDGGSESQGSTASTSVTTTASTTDASSSSGGGSSSATAGTVSAGSESGSSSGGGSSGATSVADSGSSGASGSSSAGSSGGSGESGGVCAMEQDSCANGETCCNGLTCCAGVPIPPGSEYCGMQCPRSDRNVKRDFAAVDGDAVLDTLAALPITTWSYRDDPLGARHIGPMAQDFQAAFAVGASDEAIFQVDADGVALAGVQALHRRVAVLQAENDGLRDAVASLQRRLDALERR